MPMPPTMPLYFTFVKSNIVPDAACLHLSKRIHSKRTEHGSLKVSAPAWSHTYRPAASHERLRQARRLWGDDSLYWQCGPAAGPTRLGDCRCLRDRRRVVAGFRARGVAIGLAVFTLATAIFFHKNFADQNQMIHFLKNIMIIGGLLQIGHFGAGRYSLDARRARDPKNVASATA